jgi:hypothetical protein
MYLSVEGPVEDPRICVGRPGDCRSLYVTSNGIGYDAVAEILESSGIGKRNAEPDLWIEIAALEKLAQLDRPTWAEDFDAMIAFAATRGWIDDNGELVAAHLVVDED